ncbi:MFS transporter [Nostoc sp. UHCC 0870]|uniref:MFS transporter n=1 Tax=Nostoc sp. UHCC 0870 TaxID=2914041 RepID=UPI001EDF4C37|nr:MFS transporter [Nostoc sp. UHCC 0870]UKP00702.1 MFS transporter [Nostoc sp. UHCC 0870]
MDSVQVETVSPLILEVPQIPQTQATLTPTAKSRTRFTKNAIRTSLKASTADAVFAAVFSLATGGILLSNFLVELDASPVVFGMMSSIPMLVNLIQPLGAYLSERTTSRFQYSLWTFGIARLLWLILLIGVVGFSWGWVNSLQLEIVTLLIVLASHLLGGLGSASWLSWLAIIVPRKLRGRYFGIRNSAASLTNLLCVPLAGLLISHWYGGTLQGYGVVLLVSIVFGMLSLGCQYFKLDINPKVQNAIVEYPHQQPENSNTEQSLPKNQSLQVETKDSLWKNSNFLMFLFYSAFWMLAVNLSAPFFNLYMLDTLHLDVSWVTLYASLQAGANMLLMIFWGKLADKIGNRLILIFIGVLVAVTPFLWLGIDTNNFDLWLSLPLLHILTGGTWAAIDLCNNNMQLEIAPIKNQSLYFAIASAVAGFSGALGTTIGSCIAQFAQHGGLLGIFALSGMLRLVALIPLMFVRE